MVCAALPRRSIPRATSHSPRLPQLPQDNGRIPLRNRFIGLQANIHESDLGKACRALRLLRAQCCRALRRCWPAWSVPTPSAGAAPAARCCCFCWSPASGEREVRPARPGSAPPSSYCTSASPKRSVSVGPSPSERPFVTGDRDVLRLNESGAVVARERHDTVGSVDVGAVQGEVVLPCSNRHRRPGSVDPGVVRRWSDRHAISA